MAELKGTNVAAGIVPFTSDDKYATHDAEYGKGGFRSVSTIANRDAIPVERKTEGMIVRVTANGLNYEWKNNAWVEWLPKGNIVVDGSLSTTSLNPVQNKVVTAKINEVVEDLGNLQTDVNQNHNDITDLGTGIQLVKDDVNLNKSDIQELKTTVAGIPRITVDTVWNATSNNPASSKAIESTISPIRRTANSANAKADTAQTTANTAKSIAEAAVPKSNIATDITGDNKTSTTIVPSVKAVFDHVSDINGELSSDINTAQTTANAALTTANNAIPKANILTNVTGSETDNTKVPGIKAITDYIKSADSTLSGQISSTNTRVSTLETWKNGIGNKGVANGVAGLDSNGKVPSAQLPSYVDDVVDVQSFVTANPTSGMTVGNVYYNTATKKLFTATSATAGVVSDPESDKIYIKISDGTLWRWSGSTMGQINGGLVLGTTANTAFRGDFGNVVYTNFGQGTNLVGTQSARDFFNNINKTSELYISSLAVARDKEQAYLRSNTRLFNGTEGTVETTIGKVSDTQCGVMTADMYKTLQEIELATFPLELNIVPSSDRVFEIGSTFNPNLGFSVYRKGVLITQSATIQVVGVPTISGNLSADGQQWASPTAISTNQKLTATATYGSQSASKVHNIYFKYKKYWGTSASTTLTNAQILALGGNTWADSRAMNATNFDCTGGKYPYYVIPASIYTGLETWVGGLKNTDLVVSDLTLTNASGGSAAYKVIRLANIQTGVLSIQFK